MEKRIKIYLATLFIFCTFALSAQQEGEVRIYNIDTHGTEEIVPSIIIKDNKIYTVDKETALPNVTPSQVIIDNKVYNVDEYGVQEIVPTYKIENDTIWRHRERN